MKGTIEHSCPTCGCTCTSRNDVEVADCDAGLPPINQRLIQEAWERVRPYVKLPRKVETTRLGTCLRARRLGYRWSGAHGAYIRISESKVCGWRVDVCPDKSIPADDRVKEHVCWWEGGDDILGEIEPLKGIRCPDASVVFFVDDEGQFIQDKE
jgi:hypothetical protein